MPTTQHGARAHARGVITFERRRADLQPAIFIKESLSCRLLITANLHARIVDLHVYIYQTSAHRCTCTYTYTDGARGRARFVALAGAAQMLERAQSVEQSLKLNCLLR